MAATNTFEATYDVSATAPAVHAFAITPANGADLSFVTRGLYVGVSGDVKVDTLGGDTVTFVGLAAGVIHPIRAKRVYATGTTATDIVGVY
jgi:hypothetical protein